MDEKIKWLQIWQHFLLRDFSSGQVLGKTQTLQQKS